MAFGSLPADLFEPVRAGGTGQSGRLEVGGDLHGLVVSLAEARSLVS
jgi:hypothetical protein